MPRNPRRSISPSVSMARLSRVMLRTAHCATYPTIMQALSAAIRCSCGLAYWFEPPSSHGSSMSIEKRRGTSLPLMPKPSTCARLCVWPCQVVTTCHSVLPLAGSRLTPSIRANRSSTLMPLTTLGATVTALPSMISLLTLAQSLKRRAIGLVQCGERCLNTLALAFGDQGREHLAEMRMPGTGVDVLPAIGSKEGGLDGSLLVCINCAPAISSKVARIGRSLRPEHSVNRGHQLNEVVDRSVALLAGEPGVVPQQLEFVEDRVLAFLFPVIEEYVLEQPRQFGIGVDALAIVKLSEQFDVQCQHQHRPSALAEHGMGDCVRFDIEAVAVRENLADHCIDAAEQGLVFQLLIAEPHQRFERNLVAERVIVAQLQDLGVDKPLDQPENIGVSAALNLAHKASFIGR